MHITLPADRWGIAENLRHRADRVFDVRFGLLLCFKSADNVECNPAQHGSRPGPKVFRGEIFTRNFAQIIVHILRGDVTYFAVFIEILKKILPGQVLQLRNCFRDALIGHPHFVHASALAAKTKMHFRSCHIDMSILHGCQAERFVFTRVFLIADADERALEQPHYRCQDFVPRQTRRSEVFTHAFANFRQSLREDHDPVVLVFVAHLAPTLMVKVLFAPARIATGCLNVAVCRGTNPDVRPGRRNGEICHAQQSLLIPNRFSLGIEIFEAVACGFA